MPVTSAAKLATHLWRGAAHNSASTLRSAFQGTATGTGAAGSSGSSTASGWASGLSSGGSSAGTGAGGAKYHAGRGAQFSYQNTGRAISQASSSTNNDANSGRDDDEERRRQKAYQLRLRSSHDRSSSGNMTVPLNLTTIQMQIRFKHAFAAKRCGQLLITGAQPESSDRSIPAEVRDASTLAEVTEKAMSDVPPSPQVKEKSAKHDKLYKELLSATHRKDVASVRRGVLAMRNLPKEEQTAAGFNLAMEALSTIRHPGQSVSDITETYVEMINNGHSPNSRTFSILIKALCARDTEIYHKLLRISNRPERRSRFDRSAYEEQMKKEDLFGQALQLMIVAHNSKHRFRDQHVYNALLRSCAMRGDVDQAVRILDLLEKNDNVKADAQTFKHLIRAFIHDPIIRPNETPEQQTARKLTACQQVFDEFVETSRGEEWEHEADGKVWSALIRARFDLGDPSGAVSMFETMLTKGGQPGSDVPAVDKPIVSTMIRGFLSNDDLPSALDWFSKIVSSEHEQGSLPLPDANTLEQLIEAVSKHSDLIEPCNRVFEAYLKVSERAGWHPQMDVLAKVVDANSAAAESLLAAERTDEAQVYLDKAIEFVGAVYNVRTPYLKTYNEPSNKPTDTTDSINSLCNLSQALLNSGRVVDAGSVLTYSGIFVDKINVDSTDFRPLGERLTSIGSKFFGIDGNELNSNPGLHLYAAAEYVGPLLRTAKILDESFAAGLTQLYRLSRAEGQELATPLSRNGYKLLIDAFCFEEEALRTPDLEALQKDGIAMLLNDLGQLSAGAIQRSDLASAIALIHKRYGQEGLNTVSAWVPDASKEAVQQPLSDDASPASEFSDEANSATNDGSTQATTAFSPPPTPLHRQDLPLAPVLNDAVYNFSPVQVIDVNLGRPLSALDHPSAQKQAPELYAKVIERSKLGTYPPPEGFAALMNTFGRFGNVERVYELYAMAQHSLHGLAGDPAWQTSAWFSVEDNMVQALSHAGRPEAATAHRHRIIAAGGAPTSSAYAALIATIRDTTDDASIAQELFDESQRFGVRPSAYLFNTVISKLSRARKAERALQLFDEMTRTFRLRPTSVTYGAVINACTRIGDEETAVKLFEKMEMDSRFKPRVPPYNTMMQYYIQNVPDREKALIYYDKMVTANVAPSAHTYKLLLDLYGAIEPVQPEDMVAVFDQIVRDRSVSVQGTHWASLINCYGCMMHDLEKAISTFDSIATHPSSRGQRGSFPDAISFEALLAVFVAHHRTDLMRSHLAKMQGSGIKMTAYVANLLIRGFSMEGEQGLQEARQLFESMSEPAAGVAAAGNHPPRAHGAGAPIDAEQLAQQGVESNATVSITADSPFANVQREPSTYETMIRAELGHGNKDRADYLVQRMEARAFPPALVIRVKSLILDDSQVHNPDAFTGGVVTHTFARSPPPMSNARLPGVSTTMTHQHAAPAQGSVRHASTAAVPEGSTGTSNPAPGLPKPNSPFIIFDRATKTSQKDRAATRRPIETNVQGVQTVGDDASRGEASRLTDYVRKTIAESLADRVQDIAREYPTIVELGAGPGYLRHFLDPKGTGTKKIIMCDTSEAALNRDRHLDGRFPFEFERRVIDEEALPFEENSLDCIVVSGGLHWTNDLPGVLIQIRRALKPDGVFIAGLCGGDTLFELRTALQLAEQEREGGISARVSPMANTRDMASLLSRAGFTIPTVDVDEVTIAYPSMYELMHDLRDMGESNAVINRRPQLRRDTLLAAGAIYEAMHGLEESPEEVGGQIGVPATFSLIYLIGWSPAPTQQKPLARGSAKQSLKDLLTGEEGDVSSRAEREEEKRQFVGLGMSIQENSKKGDRNK